MDLPSSMSLAERKAFYEEITMNAVGDTVEKLLAYPYGFHGDTGIRDFLYARLHLHGGKKLDFDDRERRPGFSTILLQAEAYTRTRWKNTGKKDKEARFDLALTHPPRFPDAQEYCHAEKLEALIAFELGKNKALKSVIDLDMAGRLAGEATRTTDVSKLYRELKHQSLGQGWAIEFYDSRGRSGAPIIKETLELCGSLPILPDGKKLVVVFVEFSRHDGAHHVSSNDPKVEVVLTKRLEEIGIAAGRDPVLPSRTPAPPSHKTAKGSSKAAVSVEYVLAHRVRFGERIIRRSAMEERARASGYVNLDLNGRTVAQLHPHGRGIALVLRATSQDQPATLFEELPVDSLAGYAGTNKLWLDGEAHNSRGKGLAIAYLIPDAVNGLGEDAPEWQDVARLLEHAKKLP